MNREEWRTLPGYEGIYEVSDLGQIKSVARIVVRSDGKSRRQPERILSQFTDRKGYQIVCLSSHGQSRMFRVHRAVLLAFVGLPADDEEGCHGNGNPSDNRLVNLRWGTRSENVRDAVRHGTHSEVAKTHCPAGHRLSEPNLLPSALPKRRCRQCHNSRSRKEVAA